MSKRNNALRLEGLRRYGFGVDVMKTVKICSHCGTVSNTSEHFCIQCGHRLPTETLFETYQKRHLHCSLCGTVVKKNTAFCPDCGHKLIIN